MDNASFLGLVHNVALLLALVVVFDAIDPRFRFPKVGLQSFGLGLLIGAICLAIMGTPWVMTPGIVFDSRSVLLGLSGLFFGTLPTCIAMGMAAAYRISVGGPGVVMGVSAIAAAGALGILWRRFRKLPLEAYTAKDFYAFGLVSHIVMVGLIFTLPWPAPLIALRTVAPAFLILYPLGTVFLGNMLGKRLARERESNELKEHKERLQKTAEVLERSETLLAKSQEIAHVGTWELTLADNRLVWTDEVYRIVGLAPQASPADYDTFLGIIHADDRQAVDSAYKESVRLGKDGYEIEHRIVRQDDGTVRYVLEKCIHLKNSEGALTGSIGMVQDITERKQAEAKEKAIQAELQRLLAEADRSRLVLLSVLEDRNQGSGKG